MFVMSDFEILHGNVDSLFICFSLVLFLLGYIQGRLIYQEWLCIQTSLIALYICFKEENMLVYLDHGYQNYAGQNGMIGSKELDHGSMF